MIRVSIFSLSVLCSLSSFGSDTTTESIPNSPLAVSFPSDWTHIRPYQGNGRYSSLSVTLPKGEFGGSPMYPDFDFEFKDSDSQGRNIQSLDERKFETSEISGIEAHVFRDNPEVRYLLDDFSHTYDSLKVTGYLIPMKDGHLTCKLTTSSEIESEHTRYLKDLKELCSSAIESGRSPNKFKNEYASKAGPDAAKTRRPF